MRINDSRADSAIADVAILRSDMRFHEGEWHFALATSTVKRGFVVRVRDVDGRVGFGYGGEIRHDGETADSMIAAVRLFAPALIGRRPRDLAAALDAWDATLYGNRRAKAALELAVVDLLGRAAELPAHELLGGAAVRDDVDVVRILQLEEPADMAASAAALTADGYRFVKVKLDGRLGLDIERVHQVRAAVGPDVGIIVDANQCYDVKNAIRFATATAEDSVDVFEQPVHRSDIAGLREVRRRVECWVEADESVATTHDAMNLIRSEAVDSLSIKIPKMGGLLRSLAVADVAAAAGLQYRVGAAFGSVLYAAANMQFIACAGASYACEVGEFEHLSDDPFSGPAVKDGTLRLPTGDGLGVQLAIAVDESDWQIAATQGSGAIR